MLSGNSRSPCGERGLKLGALTAKQESKVSLPVWGAWIETWFLLLGRYTPIVAPRVGSVD